MLTNLGISCVGLELPGFESMRDAYLSFCALWASLEYQEKSAKKRNSGELTAPHMFGADGYVCMGQL
jgi:hypothetical protein